MQRLAYCVMIYLIIGLTGCSQQTQAPSGSTPSSSLTPLPAQDVFGQTIFTENGVNLVDHVGVFAPSGIAVYNGSTTPPSLYVADTENSRIFVYRNLLGLTLNLSGIPVADIVIGQADMNSSLCNQGLPGTPASAATLCRPSGVAVDPNADPDGNPANGTGVLYVADTQNNRILGFSNLSAWTSGTATFATSTTLTDAGQSFTASQFINFLLEITGGAGAGQVRTITGNTATKLIVSSAWTTIPDVTSTYQITTAASIVLGQPDFVTTTSNTGGLGPGSLRIPEGVAVDSAGHLYVADSGNSRALEYDTPLTSATARLVFGQPDKNSGRCNLGGETASATSLCIPEGVAVDSLGNLYVADTNNNRVLEYDQPMTPSSVTCPACGDTTADIAIGQPDFSSNTCGTTGSNTLCGPAVVALDALGNLYVADTNNNRLLEYGTPLSTGMAATNVLGQNGSLTTNSCNNSGVSPSTLCSPEGVALDNLNSEIYVADANNNRVLRYPTPLTPGSVGSADTILGQIDGFHNAINFVDGIGLDTPSGVAVDRLNNFLYIVDTANNRVLGYNIALDLSLYGSPIPKGTPADIVIGQPLSDFNSYLCNIPNPPPGFPSGPSPISLCQPTGVAVDSNGNLYVADSGNNRVLEYDSPFFNDTTADRVFGQPDFVTTTSNTGGLSAGSLNIPMGVALDSAGNLYVADSGNNRVLEYNTPLTNATANNVFGQGNVFDVNSDSLPANRCNNPAPEVGGLSAKALCFPQSIALDSSLGNLYLADTYNNRVLEYDSPLTSATANRVFGQPDFFSYANNNPVSATSLSFPTGVAVDSTNDLYVADTNNSRVLVYTTPVASVSLPQTAAIAASAVLGQPDFVSTACNNSATAVGGLSKKSLCFPPAGLSPTPTAPVGIAFDSGDNHYVADTLNYRVLQYPLPP